MTPIYIDVFWSVIHDSAIAQVATVAVLLLITMDILFGVTAAALQHRFSSEKMRQGIGHKAGELGFMLFGIIVDGALLGGFDFGFSAVTYLGICAYIGLMEGSSLLETFAILNPTLREGPVFRMLEKSNVVEVEEE